MTGVRNYEDLNVWKLSNEIRLRMRPILDRAEFVRHSKLREQMEECIERPCPQIAEGFARYLPGDNAKFVRIAAASLAELLEHLTRARARKLITDHEADDLRLLARRARGAANGYIRYLQSAEAPHVEPPPRRRRRRREPNLNPERKGPVSRPAPSDPNPEP